MIPSGAFQRGLSLVELMVAMLLGLLLMGSVVGVVLNSKTSFIAVRESAMLQENGRYAMELLTREIRMAGYQECARGNAKLANTVKNTAGTWYLSWPGSTTAAGQSLQGLQGFDGVATPASSAAWPADYRAAVAANTDSIVIRRGDTTSYSAVINEPQLATSFRVNKVTDFKAGELVMAVAPACTQVGIFQAQNAAANTITRSTTGTPGNCFTDLSGGYNCGLTGGKSSTAYRIGSTLTRFNATAFFIAPTETGQPTALYRRAWASPGALVTDELVRGVEDMQITYGLDTRSENGAAIDNSTVFGDGVADKYVYANDTALTTWNAAINWNSVVSVKVVLQMRSINTVYTSDTAFDKCDGSGAGTPDKYLHKCLSSTIAIRNQGL
jgi:type IV pilus assembly protein PilW